MVGVDDPGLTLTESETKQAVAPSGSKKPVDPVRSGVYGTVEGSVVGMAKGRMVSLRPVEA